MGVNDATVPVFLENHDFKIKTDNKIVDQLRATAERRANKNMPVNLPLMSESFDKKKQGF